MQKNASKSAKYDSHVIVVHGVGDQKKGETAEAMTVSLATKLKSLGHLPLIRSGDTRIVQCSEDVLTTNTLEVRDQENNDIRITVTECHWAELSSLSGGMLQNARGFWRILVGLPKLGYHAVESLPTNSWCKRTFLSLYVMCWIAISFRLVLFTLLGTAKAFLDRFVSQDSTLGSIGRSLWHEFPIISVDFVVSLGFALLSGAFLLLLRSDRDGENTRIAGRIAIISIAMAFLFTMHIPAAVNWLIGPGVHSIVESELLQHENPKLAAALKPDNSPLFGALYSKETLCGMWSYLLQAAYFLLLIASLAKYAWMTFKDTSSDQRAHSGFGIEEMLAKLSQRAYWLALLLVFAGSFLWLLEFTVNSIDEEYMFFTGFPKSTRAFISFLCASMILLLTLIGKTRDLLAPIFELLLDVASYFPAIPWLERKPFLAFFLGVKSANQPQTLAPELADRLSSLIHANRYEEGSAKIIIVGHSLGSVIAYDTLRDSRMDKEELEDLSLITMGSPIGKLEQLYPHLFNAVKLRVSSWSNFCRRQDYVGTRILGKTSEVNSIEENDLGPGGHLGYFAEPEVASKILELSVTK